MALEWRNLYSHTDEPDKQNRWARLLYCNNLLIGWINRIELNSKITFNGMTYFPVLENNHSSFYSKNFDNYQDAKDLVENLWKEFKKKINDN